MGQGHCQATGAAAAATAGWDTGERAGSFNEHIMLTILPLSQDERHTYEKCQYEEFKKRVAKMDELRAAADYKRAN